MNWNDMNQGAKSFAEVMVQTLNLEKGAVSSEDHEDHKETPAVSSPLPSIKGASGTAAAAKDYQNKRARTMSLHNPVSTSTPHLVNSEMPPLGRKDHKHAHTRWSSGSNPNLTAKSFDFPSSSSPSHDDRRKTTPPDLLELSNIYFDRQQKLMRRSNSRTVGEAQPANLSRLKSTSQSSFQAIRPATTDLGDLGNTQDLLMGKPIKLEPIHKRSIAEEPAPLRLKSNSHGLHLSVNFSSSAKNSQRSPQLDPMDHTGPKTTLQELMTRKHTFSLQETAVLGREANCKEHTTSMSIKSKSSFEQNT